MSLTKLQTVCVLRLLNLNLSQTCGFESVKLDLVLISKTRILMCENSINILSLRWRGCSFWSPTLGRQGAVVTLLSCQFPGIINSSSNLVNVYALKNRLQRSLFFGSVH